MNRSALIDQPAPDFTAPIARADDKPADPVQTVSLSDYRDRWLVFFWYPADFTFVCPTEIIALSDRLEEFEELDTDILGASTDSVYSHRAWLRTPRTENGIAGVRFPLLSDRSGEIAREWGVLVEKAHIALRGLFIVDPAGIVQYCTITGMNVGRSVDETVRILQAIQSGGLCGSDWKPGQETISTRGV